MTTVAVRGVPIRVITVADAARQIAEWVETRTHTFVSCASVHLVEEANANAEVMRALQAAGMVLPDGAPVAWAAGILGGSVVPRTTGSDLFAAVLAWSPPRIRHFFYGGHPDVLARLCQRVVELRSDVTIAGTHAPPFRALSEREWLHELALINEARPDVVWVGLGGGRQDLWMADARPHLEAPVLIGVGAVFDFVSGEKRRAPAVMRRAGLEWLFRLGCEPRRLWRRYAVTNTRFVRGVAIAILRGMLRGGAARWPG